MTGQPTTDTDPTAQPIPGTRIVFTGEDRREIADRVSDALCTGTLTLGENTRQFEAAFAHAHQAQFAVAVASGTAAHWSRPSLRRPVLDHGQKAIGHSTGT